MEQDFSLIMVKTAHSQIQCSSNNKAIKSHKYIPKEYLLEFPGLVDISYFVDFNNLRKSCEKNENSELISNNRRYYTN